MIYDISIILENSPMPFPIKSHPYPSPLKHLFFDSYHDRLILPILGLSISVMILCVTVCVYLSLPSFTQHNGFGVHPCFAHIMSAFLLIVE